MAIVKQCRKCAKAKLLSEFYKRASSADGLCGQCKSCMKLYYRDWSSNNKDRLRAAQAEWRKNNRDRVAGYVAARPRKRMFSEDGGNDCTT